MAEIKEKLYTIDDLWEMDSDSDTGKLIELVRGEFVMASGSGAQATILAGWLLRKIGNYVDDHDLGYVSGADGNYVLATKPDTTRIPDLGFVKKERMPKPIPLNYIPVPPDLAVEVISPNDKAKDIRDRINDYLAANVPLIWVIYPSSQRVDIYRASDKAHAEIVGLDGTLKGEDVLPRFSLSVKDVFEVLE
jgi:Uma2 family endonuclease